MDIAYIACTETCTFLLDEDGICRKVIRGAEPRNGDTTAERCVGAQYVASLDVRTEGGLVAMPKLGTGMIFAYVGPGGRIALIRTGPLLRFEARRTATHESGVREMPRLGLVDLDHGDDEIGSPTQRLPIAELRPLLDASASSKGAQRAAPRASEIVEVDDDTRTGEAFAIDLLATTGRNSTSPGERGPLPAIRTPSRDAPRGHEGRPRTSKPPIVVSTRTSLLPPPPPHRSSMTPPPRTMPRVVREDAPTTEQRAAGRPKRS